MKSKYVKRLILLVTLVVVLLVCIFALFKAQKDTSKQKTEETKQSASTSNTIDSSDFKLSEKELLKKYPESAHLLIGLKGSEVTLPLSKRERNTSSQVPML